MKNLLFIIILTFFTFLFFHSPQNVYAQTCDPYPNGQYFVNCDPTCDIPGSCGSMFHNCQLGGLWSDGSGTCQKVEIRPCSGNPNSCQLPNSCDCNDNRHTYTPNCGGGSVCIGQYSDGCSYCQTTFRPGCQNGTCSRDVCDDINDQTDCGTSTDPCFGYSCGGGPPPPVCNTTSYPQCGTGGVSCSNGVSYPPNIKVSVDERACSDGTTTFNCSSQGAPPCECGNPGPACAPPRCGNGLVEPANSEVCDAGDSGNGACPAGCSSSCQFNNCPPPNPGGPPGGGGGGGGGGNSCPGSNCGGNPTSCSLNTSPCSDSGCLPNGQTHVCSNGARVFCNNGCLAPTSGGGGGGGGLPGCTTYVGIGGNCNRGQGVCCSQGTCNDSGGTAWGTCRNIPPPQPCDPLGPVSGSPANGTTGLSTNVSLNWQTNEPPALGACSNSGRNWQLWYGDCPTGTYIPPGSPNGCSQPTYIFGRTNNYTCTATGTASWPVNFPGNPASYGLSGLGNGWHYWRVEITCSCHYCVNGSPPVTNGFWTFQVGANITQPAAPILVCQASGAGNSGDPNDICDASQGSLGYGNLQRYNLNARDGGPASSRQILYSHRYTIVDQMTGTVYSPIGPNYGAGALFGIDGRSFLTNGHRYNWSVTTWDNNSPPSSPPNSPPSSIWSFLYDTAPPTVSISSPSLCFDPITPPPNFPVNVSDPGTPTQASNIATVTATITNGAGVVVSSQNLMPSCSWGGLPPGQGVGTCSVNTSGLPPTGTYTVSVTSTDNAGNSNSATTRFVYRALCIGPWLQSTGGDVHSNTGINAPGGPP